MILANGRARKQLVVARGAEQRTGRWRGALRLLPLRGDGGSVSLELVILAPALLLLTVGIVAAGRVAQAHQAVGLAASQAARATALAANPAAGVAAGRSQATSAVGALGQTCRLLEVDVGAGGLARTPGTAANVSVTVNCHVALSDLMIPGVPGTIRVVENASEPVDRWLVR